MPSQLVSFDVFDTLLTRSTGSPESTFLLFGQRLEHNGLIQCSAAVFAHLREQAEHRAFANAGGLDSHVTLRDIYAELALGLHIDSLAVMQQELLFEREHLCVIDEGRRRLEQARADGHQIVFVSDMYLSAGELGSLLDSFGIRRAGDQTMVSSEYGLSKRSGALFRELLKTSAMQPTRIVHHGNDAISDLKMPRRLNIATQPFMQGNLNRFEQTLDQATISTDGLSGALAGASRLARLTTGKLSQRDQTIVDTSCAVAAPLVIGFVLWALRNAMAANVQRLYFIARDGQLLLSVARILARKIGCEIELKYLHGSRRAWQAASLHDSFDETVLRLIPPTGHVDAETLNIAELLDRFDTTPDELEQELAEIGIHRSHWPHPLLAHQCHQTAKLLMTNTRVRSLLISRSERARDMLLSYLRQHQVDQPGAGILDLGTGGTLFNALADILATINAPAPQAYYFGQRELPRHTDHWRVPQVYMYDTNHQRGIYHQNGIVGYLEAVCSADHGTTIGYQRHEDKVVPILSDGATTAVQDWGHPLVSESVLNVARRLAIGHRERPIWQADIRAVATQCFTQFWTNPTHVQAVAWGSFPLDDGQGQHVRALQMATPYRIYDALTPGEPHRHWWHNGALALSGPTIRGAFVVRDIALRLVRRIRRKLRSIERRQAPVLAPKVEPLSPASAPDFTHETPDPVIPTAVSAKLPVKPIELPDEHAACNSAPVSGS